MEIVLAQMRGEVGQVAGHDQNRTPPLAHSHKTRFHFHIFDPCTATFVKDVWEYFPWETMVMWEWGPVVNSQTGQQKWELITSASGAYILDPPEASSVVATPEPSSLVLLRCGLVLLLRRANLVASR